jgi:hypothetical protein
MPDMADEHDEAGILVEEGDKVVLLNELHQAGFLMEQAGIQESFLLKVNNDYNKK